MSDTHSLIWHGDSIELSQRLKPGTIQSIVTDPPFGVDNQSNMAVTSSGKEYARKIANDESPEQAIQVFTDVMEALLPAMKEESDIYVFTAHQVLSEWLVFLDGLFAPHSFRRKAVLVWEKDGPGMGDLESWGMGCEFILYYKRGGRKRTAPRRNNVLHYSQLRPNELIHPHEKPTQLLESLIAHSAERGDWIVDPFGGSGSTTRAARNLGVNSIAMELDEKNYTLALKKLEEGEGAGMFG